MGTTNYQSIVNMQNGFKAGTGTTITKILKGTVTVNPASLNATTAATTTATLTGAVVGDSLIVAPPAAGLTAGVFITAAWVSAADEIKISLYNSTGGAIDEASASWVYTLIRS